DRLFDEWHFTAGSLIGLEQVGSVTDCPVPPTATDATTCFARLVTAKYGSATIAATGGTLGIVAVAPWTITAHTTWEIGIDSIWNLANRSRRYLLEAQVLHMSPGRVFRFYVTHLSHGGQYSQRQDQLDKINDLITQRASSDRTPPILVGDMNFSVDGGNSEPE